MLSRCTGPLPRCQRCLPEHCSWSPHPQHAKVWNPKRIYWYDPWQNDWKRNSNNFQWLQIWPNPSKQWPGPRLQSSHVWLQILQYITDQRINRKKRMNLPLGNVMGYPGVFQGNPCLYPWKPAPVHKGTGFDKYRSRVWWNPWVSKPVQDRNMGSH